MPKVNTADPQAAAIADAEEQLQMLRRLAALGMGLAEEVCERAINSPYHPEPTHEPARAFATVSRAVRLTIVLQTKLQAELLALRNGNAARPAHLGAARQNVGVKADPPTVNDAADDDDALETLDRARESLVERERFDEILSRPFDECVAAIRCDLGLALEDDVTSVEPDLPLSPECAKASQESSAPMRGPAGVRAHDPPDTG